MSSQDRKTHWNAVFSTKDPEQMSWYQEYPATSMRFIREYGQGRNAHIIDIGGGTSQLIPCLIEEEYGHLTVLDVSSTALSQAAERLGARRHEVEWITTDVLAFRAEQAFDIWHDRATFHFLTEGSEVEAYLRKAAQAIRTDGILILATFSEMGPENCSDLPVHRYSQDELTQCVSKYFERIECLNEDHITPVARRQNFTYCAFRRNAVEVGKIR